MTASTVDAATLSGWIAANEALVIDVREPAEFAGGHIPGSLSVPMSKLGSIDLPPAGARKLVLVCASGRRSEMSCGTVAAKTGGTVHSLTGGLAAWRQSGGAVVGTGRNVLPLDRQVLIGAGSVVLTGVALGTLVHPGFYALSAFAGAGLIVAGTTGFCGMALILARMPWNQAPRAA
jgi:rhodanese-related sulfurtransferase